MLTQFYAPAAAAPPSRENQLSTMPKVFVRQIKLEGNTVFLNGELSEILVPFENRFITSEELQDLRRKLTHSPEARIESI
jgi:hemolysin activation/secretion protein